MNRVRLLLLPEHTGSARERQGTPPLPSAAGHAWSIWLVRSSLTAGLIDEIHLAIAPVLMGRGEHLLAGIDMVRPDYKCAQHAATDDATHVVLTM